MNPSTLLFPAGTEPADGSSGPANGTTPAAPPNKKSSVGLWARDLLVSTAASILINTFLYQPVRVKAPVRCRARRPRPAVLSIILFIAFLPSRSAAISWFSVIRAIWEKSYIMRYRPSRRSPPHRSGLWSAQRRTSESYVPEQHRCTAAWVAGDGDPRRPLFHDGRPPLDLRQPRVWLRSSARWYTARLNSSTGRRGCAWCAKCTKMGLEFTVAWSEISPPNLIKSVESTLRRGNAGNSRACRWAHLPRPGYGAPGDCQGEVVFNTSRPVTRKSPPIPPTPGKLSSLRTRKSVTPAPTALDNEASKPYIEGLDRPRVLAHQLQLALRTGNRRIHGALPGSSAGRD